MAGILSMPRFRASMMLTTLPPRCGAGAGWSPLCLCSFHRAWRARDADTRLGSSPDGIHRTSADRPSRCRALILFDNVHLLAFRNLLEVAQLVSVIHRVKRQAFAIRANQHELLFAAAYELSDRHAPAPWPWHQPITGKASRRLYLRIDNECFRSKPDPRK